MELCALAAVGSQDHFPRHYAIIGSGPLPLTSICMWHQLECNNRYIKIQNIDQDHLAVSVSQSMCQKLGFSKDELCVQCGEAGDGSLDLAHFDVVYLAALVGHDSPTKYIILAGIVKRLRPGGQQPDCLSQHTLIWVIALLVIRSVLHNSLRRLLYPVIVYS